jgi:hypothetical protein
MGSACARERHQTKYQEKVSEAFPAYYLVELDTFLLDQALFHCADVECSTRKSI